MLLPSFITPACGFNNPSSLLAVGVGVDETSSSSTSSSSSSSSETETSQPNPNNNNNSNKPSNEKSKSDLRKNSSSSSSSSSSGSGSGKFDKMMELKKERAKCSYRTKSDNQRINTVGVVYLDNGDTELNAHRITEIEGEGEKDGEKDQGLVLSAYTSDASDLWGGKYLAQRLEQVQLKGSCSRRVRAVHVKEREREHRDCKIFEFSNGDSESYPQSHSHSNISTPAETSSSSTSSNEDDISDESDVSVGVGNLCGHTNADAELALTITHLLGIWKAVHFNVTQSRYAVIAENDVIFPFDIDWDKLVASASIPHSNSQCLDKYRNLNTNTSLWEEQSRQMCLDTSTQAGGAGFAVLQLFNPTKPISRELWWKWLRNR